MPYDLPLAVLPYNLPLAVLPYDLPLAVLPYDRPSAVSPYDLPLAVSPYDRPFAVCHKIGLLLFASRSAFCLYIQTLFYLSIHIGSLLPRSARPAALCRVWLELRGARFCMESPKASPQPSSPKPGTESPPCPSIACRLQLESVSGWLDVLQLQYTWKILAVGTTAVLLHLGAETGMHALVTVLLAVRSLLPACSSK